MSEKRSAFLLFINTEPGSGAGSYALVGDGVTELSISYNAQTSTEQFRPLPDLGAGMRALAVERSSPAVMAARYDDGHEDYQIFMVMTYEVRPNHD